MSSILFSNNIRIGWKDGRGVLPYGYHGHYGYHNYHGYSVFIENKSSWLPFFLYLFMAITSHFKPIKYLNIKNY